MNASAAVTRSNTFLRRITPKLVCEAIGIDLVNLQRPVQPRVLYDLFGTIRSARVVPDKSGQGRPPSIKFGGRFRAVTPDGETFDSGVTFIPIMDEIIASTLTSVKAGDEEAELEIALRVAIKTAPTGKPSMTGYEFDVQRLFQAVEQVNDPIARLQAQAAEAQKALPAPKVSPATPTSAAGVSAGPSTSSAPASDEGGTQRSPEGGIAPRSRHKP